MRFLSPVCGRLVSAVVVSNLLLTSLASAAPTDGSRAAAAPLDEVRLTDGTLVRGTILEQTAEGNVTFATATGEVRKFAKKDVAYAGPIGGAPSAPAALPPASVPAAPISAPAPAVAVAPSARPEASVAFSTDAPDVQVHLRESSATMKLGVAGYSNQVQLDSVIYRPICVAPCTAAVPLGMQRFGLSHGNDGVVDIDSPIDTRPGSAVAFHFDSNESMRTAGKVMFWGGIVGGSVLAVAGFVYSASSSSNDAPVGSAQWNANNQDFSSHTTTGLIIGGVGMLVGAGISIVGWALTRTKDEASLAPATPPAGTPPATTSAPKTAPTPADEGSFPGSQQ